MSFCGFQTPARWSEGINRGRQSEKMNISNNVAAVGAIVHVPVTRGE
jgi:hypothetical protein